MVSPTIQHPALIRATSRFDVAHYLLSRGFQPQESGMEYVIDCPRCRGRRKLYVNAFSKLFLCFRCSPPFRGGLTNLVMLIDNLSYAQAVTFITGYQQVWAAEARVSRYSEGLPEGFAPLTDPSAQFESLFWTYLSRRGIDYYTVMRYGIGRTYGGPYLGRVIIPVTTEGKVVHWVARDATGQQAAKVLTPPGGKQARYLFNLDHVGQLGAVPHLVVVEGVFDALRDPTVCVASFGKRLSDAQVALLLRCAPVRVTIAYDGDAYADAVSTAARLIGVFPEVRVARLPPTADPADLSLADFRECIATARVPDPAYRVLTKLRGLRASL